MQSIFKFSALSVFLLNLLFSFGAISVISCGQTPGADTAKSSQSDKISRQDLLKIIEGGWVNQDYRESLIKLHSPMFAAEAGRPVQEMFFDISNVSGDTVLNGTGRLNYMEGERFDVVFFEKDGATKMKIDQGRNYADSKVIYLDYSISASADTMLLLINQANNDTDLFVREFRSAPMKAGIPVNALEHFVNLSMFEGEWTATDGTKVVFDASGNVTGWGKWTWYSVEIDKYGAEVQPDIISLYNEKIGASYVYTLDNDRLSVYNYDAETDDSQWSRGNLVVELVRKKQ